MANTKAQTRKGKGIKSWMSWDTALAYGIAAMAVGFTAVLGSTFTYSSVRSKWYECIQPSELTPPRAVFPIVWSILYVLIALAFGIAITSCHSAVVVMFVINLILNAAWSWAYFMKRDVALAFAIIVGMLFTIIHISATCKDRFVMYVMIPYAIWVSFATLLNFLSLQNLSRCQKTQMT